MISQAGPLDWPTDRNQQEYLGSILIVRPSSLPTGGALYRNLSVKAVNQVFRSVYFEKPSGPPCVCYAAFN